MLLFTKSRFFIPAILMAVLFCPTISVHAQVSSAINQNDITVKVNPQIPGPNEDTTITLSSFIINLDKSDVQWIVDGKSVRSGTGDKSFMVTTGGVGSTITVVAIIKTPNTPTITKQVILRPAEIDILWEAIDSYVPPFYRGKTMPASESRIKVAAIPNMKNATGGALKSTDLVYTWKRNFSTIQANSGFAKNSFTFTNSYLNPKEDISVIVSGVSNNTTADASITITPVAPKILFYEQSPLYGTRYQTALTQAFTMNTNETGLVAEPYYFSSKNISNPDLTYAWTVNNSKVTSPYPKNILPVQKGTTGGSAKVNLSIESMSKLFQTASRTLYVNL